MKNVIEFLKVINQQTRGVFFIFGYVIFLFIISFILFFNDIYAIKIGENIDFVVMLLLYYANIIINSVVTTLILCPFWILYKIIKWVYVDLFCAVKNAFKEIYSNNIK